MVTTRELVERLLESESEDGVELAFRELKERSRNIPSLRNAAVIGIGEWRELGDQEIAGMLTAEQCRVSKARLTDRVLRFADRMDRAAPIQTEADKLIADHQRLAEFTKGKDEEVVIYCHGPSCGHSSIACANAVSWGYTKVYYFRDGFPGWKAAGHPTSTN